MYISFVLNVYVCIQVCCKIYELFFTNSVYSLPCVQFMVGTQRVSIHLNNHKYHY